MPIWQLLHLLMQKSTHPALHEHLDKVAQKSPSKELIPGRRDKSGLEARMVAAEVVCRQILVFPELAFHPERLRNWER